MLPTAGSPTPFGAVVVYQDDDFAGVGSRDLDWPNLCELSQIDREREASIWRSEEFEVMREVHKTRAFRLVLSAYIRVRGSGMDSYPVRTTTEAIAREQARRGFDWPILRPVGDTSCAEHL